MHSPPLRLPSLGGCADGHPMCWGGGDHGLDRAAVASKWLRAPGFVCGRSPSGRQRGFPVACQGGAGCSHPQLAPRGTVSLPTRLSPWGTGGEQLQLPPGTFPHPWVMNGRLSPPRAMPVIMPAADAGCASRAGAGGGRPHPWGFTSYWVTPTEFWGPPNCSLPPAGLGRGAGELAGGAAGETRGREPSAFFLRHRWICHRRGEP